jgi:hypothetical protein
MTLSEWVRAVLLAAPGVELPDDEAALAGRVTLAEVLALRSLLLNLHFRTAKGEPIPEPEMRALIERADGVKMQRARERLEAARGEARPEVTGEAGSSTRNRGRAGRTCGRGEHSSLAACSSSSRCGWTG